MASGFLWQRYSICTVLTGATTCRRGRAASRSAAHVISTVSSSNSSSGTATALPFTAEAMDLISRLSVRRFWMAPVSITETPRRSSCFASSIFSRKLRAKPPSFAGCGIVMSLMEILRIACFSFTKQKVPEIALCCDFRDEKTVFPRYHPDSSPTWGKHLSDSDKSMA